MEKALSQSRIHDLISQTDEVSYRMPVAQINEPVVIIENVGSGYVTCAVCSLRRPLSLENRDLLRCPAVHSGLTDVSTVTHDLIVRDR